MRADVANFFVVAPVAFLVVAACAVWAGADYAGPRPYLNEAFLRVNWPWVITFAVICGMVAAVAARLIRGVFGRSPQTAWVAIAVVLLLLAVAIPLRGGYLFITVGTPGPGECQAMGIPLNNCL